jgi:hypothetical protein
MKYIELTQGKNAIVDDEDLEIVAKYKWHYNNGYACRRIHKRISFKKYKGEYVYMHRLLAKAKTGVVDHINGNRLDNRKSNLRVCTQSDNMCNQINRRTNKWGYVGVYYAKDRNKFAARLRYKNKTYGLGYFETVELAARARDKGAIKIHKEYARLNNV